MATKIAAPMTSGNQPPSRNLTAHEATSSASNGDEDAGRGERDRQRIAPAVANDEVGEHGRDQHRHGDGDAVRAGERRRAAEGERRADDGDEQHAG